jgi:hypothetical protein
MGGKRSAVFVEDVRHRRSGIYLPHGEKDFAGLPFPVLTRIKLREAGAVFGERICR